MPSSRPSLVRAVAAGLCGGLLIGGVYLLFVAARSGLWPPDCRGMTPQECRIERLSLQELARWQAAAGLALLLLGVAVGLRARAR